MSLKRSKLFDLKESLWSSLLSDLMDEGLAKVSEIG